MSNNSEKFVTTIFPIILSFIAGLIICISQTGFNYSYLLIFKSFFLCTVLIYLPLFFQFLLKNYLANYFLSKSLLNFCSFFSIILLSQFSIYLNIDFSYLLFFCGIIIIYFILKDLKIYFKSYFLFILFFIFFSLWTTSVFYYNHYANPLIYEKIATGSFAHRDHLWHSSIAAMIKNYGIPGIGIDGIYFYHYHIFSNFIFGSLSGLLKINTLEFYSSSIPILIIPLFFLYFIDSLKEINHFFEKKLKYEFNLFKSYIFWFGFLSVFSLPIPFNFLSDETWVFFTSYSYFIALLLLFIKIGIIFSLINNNFFLSNFNLKSLFIIFILTFLSFCIFISKFSFLYFISISYIFFYFRLKLFKNLLYSFLCFCLFLTFLFVYFIFIYNFQIESPNWGFSRSYLDVFLIEKDYSTYYKYLYPTIFFIFIKYINFKDKSIMSIKDKFNNYFLIDIEYLFFLAIALFLFPWPFTYGIQIYIANMLILSQLGYFIKNYRSI